MTFEQWTLSIGALLLTMAFLHPFVKRLPVTTALVYLLVGFVLGPAGFGAADIDPLRDAAWLLRAAEVTVVISLFTVGMKLRLPLRDPQLRPALCLASVSMVLTVFLIAGAGMLWLDLPPGAAILLGAVLAPTDPVLASDVQLRHAHDQDELRLTLTAEGGLNDGTAFPFVMLGLGLLGLHELGEGGWRWWTVDVAWAVGGGLAIGGALGFGLGRLMIHLHARRAKAIAFGEYLVLGLIGVAYGGALLAHTYGFLAVFAAGLALRAVERRASPGSRAPMATITAGSADQAADQLASNPKTAPAYLAGVLLATNELLEHLLEVGAVLIVGAALLTAGIAAEALWFAPLLFLVIRPIAVLPLLAVSRFTVFEFASVSWFGIRGIGSLYYLMYAVQHGLPAPLADRLVSLTLTVVALSILVHGISVTPLINRYTARATRR